MAIEKYTSHAIVIESYDQNENDRAYKLYTREFGMLVAHAKSVRKLESKLRAHILPRTLSIVTLVKGKEVWRLVGAEQQSEAPKHIYEVVSLLNRFIRGDGSHISLYDQLLRFLDVSRLFDPQKSRLLLYFLVLVELGYADVKVVGAKNSKEYTKWSIEDLYTHLLLSYGDVREHVHAVMKEMQM